MSLTPDEFSSLAPDAKMTVLYSQLVHMRNNLAATSQAYSATDHDHEHRLTVIEARLSILGVLGLAALGLGLTALLRAAGIL